MEPRLKAFLDNPKVNVYHVTEDGIPFANKGDAQNQAAALKRAGKGTGKIETITRAQAEQLIAAEQSKGQGTSSKNQEPNANPVLTPRQQAEQVLADAVAARDKANNDLDAANAAKAALAADAAPADKTKATKAVNTATTALETAEAAVVAAKNAVDALPTE